MYSSQESDELFIWLEATVKKLNILKSALALMSQDAVQPSLI